MSGLVPRLVLLLDSKFTPFGYNRAGQGPGLGTTGSQSGRRQLRQSYFFIITRTPRIRSPDINLFFRVRAGVRAGTQRTIWSNPGSPGVPAHKLAGRSRGSRTAN